MESYKSSQFPTTVDVRQYLLTCYVNALQTRSKMNMGMKASQLKVKFNDM